MRAKDSQNPTYVPVINQSSRTMDKSPKGLVRLVHKFAKSITKTSSKVYEPLTYDKIINNLVHRRR